MNKGRRVCFRERAFSASTRKLGASSRKLGASLRATRSYLIYSSSPNQSNSCGSHSYPPLLGTSTPPLPRCARTTKRRRCSMRRPNGGVAARIRKRMVRRGEKGTHTHTHTYTHTHAHTHTHTHTHTRTRTPQTRPPSPCSHMCMACSQICLVYSHLCMGRLGGIPDHSRLRGRRVLEREGRRRCKHQ